MHLHHSVLTLALLLQNVLSVRIRYADSEIVANVTFGGQKPVILSTVLDINSDQSFVFGRKCAKRGTCTKQAHTTYDISGNNQTKNHRFRLVMNGQLFQGTACRDTISVEDLEVIAPFGAVTEVSCAPAGKDCRPDFVHDALLGLKADTSAVFRRLGTVAVVQDACDLNNTGTQSGSVYLGERLDTIEECGKSTRIDTFIPNRRLMFRSRVTIQKQTLNLKTIIDPNGPTVLRKRLFQRLFEKSNFTYEEAAQTLEDITILINDDEFVIPVGDYVFKSGPNIRELLILEGDNQDKADFILGQIFLQRNCIALQNGVAGSPQLLVAPNLVNEPGDGMEEFPDDNPTKTSSLTVIPSVLVPILGYIFNYL